MKLPFKISCAFAALLLLSSCGKQESTTTAAAQPAPAPSPAAVATAPAPAPAALVAPTPTPSAAVKKMLALVTEKAGSELSGMSTAALAEVLPLPPAVEKMRAPLAAAGQSGLLQQLSGKLATTAGSVLQATPALLRETVAGLDVAEAVAAVRGSDDSLTRFVQTRARGALVAKLTPLVAQAATAAGATDTLAQITSALEGPAQSSGLMSSVQSFTGVAVPAAKLDLNAYVTEVVVGKIFDVLGEQERKLRADPNNQVAQLMRSLLERTGN